jgi:hypothetical protein
LSHKPGVYDVFSFFHELDWAGHLDGKSAFESGPNVPKTGLEYEKSQLRSQLFEALRKFMHAPFTPWWTRIWVIQEVTAPLRVTITYGTISASWDMFANAAKSYLRHSSGCCKWVIKTLPPDQEKVVTDSCKKIKIIEDLRMRQHPLDLLSLLRQFRDRKASDSRDKVYALLSMVQTPRDREPLIPDYSLAETEVFCQAAPESIYTTASLPMFGTELERKFRNDLPSWVPDWGAPGGYTYTARAEAIRLYDASLEEATPTTVVRPVNGSMLRLRATKLETVDALGEVMLGDSAFYSRETLGRWWFLWSHSTPTVEAEKEGVPMDSLREKFLMCLCAGVIHITLPGRLDGGTRRVRAYDASTFEAWERHSRLSPFSGPGDEAVSNESRVWTKLWEYYMLLWPKDPLSHSSDTLGGRDHVLRYGLQSCTLEIREAADGLIRYANKTIDRVNQYGHKLDTSFIKRVYNPEGFLFAYGKFDREKLWQELFIIVRQLLRDHYGPEIDIHCDVRHLIPDVDNSINIATLLRRLIIVGNSIGLGPAGTAVGDEVFLLSGGKTPFVLRRHEDTNKTTSGPKYKIIGDCYVQEWMDGDAERLASCEWMDITLV